MPVSPNISSMIQGSTPAANQGATPAASNSPYQQAYNAAGQMYNPYSFMQGNPMAMQFLSALNQMRSRQMAQYPQSGDQAYLSFNPAPGAAATAPTTAPANNGVNPQPMPVQAASKQTETKTAGPDYSALIKAGLLVPVPSGIGNPNVSIYGGPGYGPITEYNGKQYWSPTANAAYKNDLFQSSRDGGG